MPHICYLVTLSCNHTCRLIRSTSPPSIDLTVFIHPPSLSAFLIVTCHLLSIPLLPTAISDEEMSIMLKQKHWQRRELCAENTGGKQAAFSQWFSKSCHIRDTRLLSYYAPLSLLANPLAHICTRYLTHSRHTSRQLFPSFPHLCSLCMSLCLFLAAESHFLRCIAIARGNHWTCYFSSGLPLCV